ncbi:MAG: flagellar hook-length control protein FliK [Butyrivibrio sp.]|nr:flagellar hook-length control protein FliK [Butyrivibrio sp.]
MSFISNIGQSNKQLVIDSANSRGQKPSEGNLNLKSGETIRGTVVSVTDTENGKIANINVGDNVISAKLSDGMGLREGQTMSFAVRNGGTSSIAITPLYENTAVSTSALKALTAAGIEVNNDTVQMVKDMMEAGLPIGRDALLEMNRNLSSHPNASISNMVEMKSLGIPVNDNNLVQFQSYKNYEHQVTSAMENIMDELPEAFNELLSSGDARGALDLYGSVLKLFGEEASPLTKDLTSGEQAPSLTADGEEAVLGQDGAVKGSQEHPALENFPLEVKTDEKMAGGNTLQTDAADGNILQEFSDGKVKTTAASEDTGTNTGAQTVSGEVTESKLVIGQENLKGQSEKAVQKDGSVSDKTDNMGYTRSSDLPAEPGKDFVNTLKSLGISDKAIDNYNQAIKLAIESGKNPESTEFAEHGKKLELAQKELMKEMAHAFEGADLTDRAESESWKKLFSGNDYNKLLKDNISSQWLLKPGDVKDKENVENLYQRLNAQVKGLTNAINGTLGAESKLSQAANNLQNNLDFMNQLNQMFQYVQLPLQMTGQNAHGDLYVYRNKNKRMSDDGSVSAVLHLDMENLGPLDVYVKMKETKVSTNFYVADDSVIDLINDNIHILNERLEKRGYSMSVRMMLHDDMDGQDAAVDEMLEVNKTPLLSINSFDARA